MRAYPGGEAQRSAIIAELEDHAAHDRLVKGRYWENGKGCAVGCTIKSGNHMEYESRFGIPVMLARFEDTIFENLPNERAMAWPVQFMSAIKPGADLSLVGWQFLAFIVGEALDRPEAASIRKACQPALDITQAKARGDSVTATYAAYAADAADAAYAADAAADAAYAAAYAADAAAYAADAAADAADAAAYAADAAAYAADAADAADAAAYAADAAAYAAYAAYAAAYAAADVADWVGYADKLLELMRAASCD